MLLNFIEWNPNPILIDLGSLAIHYYSLLFASGFILSYIILNKYFKKQGLEQDYLDSLVTYVVLGTIIGARLGHCLFYDWEYFSQHPMEIFLPFKFEPEFEITGFRGLASHGGILGVLLALLLFSKNKKIEKWWLLDMLALVGPLAGMCIRLGNLMNSEIVGAPSDVPWAFIFVQVDNVPRHPGQLYEALAYLGIFIVLNILYHKKYKELGRGVIFGLFFVLLFSARFLLEFTKANQKSFEDDMLINMGQLLSIPFLIGGLYVMWKQWNEPYGIPKLSMKREKENKK
ncbi:prolipoprotein diacylglyceryl transferase [Marinigracilibium pacificum]|nr:prolipoprotein diacylglyceryl transferase [Marinigracilibium pacificum]